MYTRNKSVFKKSALNIQKILNGICGVAPFKNKALNSKIIITTGGTCGHITPAMKIASDLVEQGKTVYFITDKRFNSYKNLFDKKDFFTSKNFKVVETPITSFKGFGGIFSFLKNSILTLLQVIFIFIKIKPKIVIGFGSYVSFFPLLIGALSFRSIILHEQNVIFGKVNKMFVRVAKTILLSFPDASHISKKLYSKISHKVIISGYPSFTAPNVDANYRKAIHDLTTKREIIILITGGSQGASFFAHKIPPAIVSVAKSFPEKTFTVYHQVRKNEIEQVLNYYTLQNVKNINLNIKPIFDNIPEILKEADIAIIRGGAGSIIETATAKVFSIIIPLTHSAGNHQVKNAMMLASNNGAVMLEEKNYTPEKLSMIFARILKDSFFYFPIINTASDLFKNDASQVFANVILYNDLESLNSYD